MVVGALLATAFGVASVYAVGLLRGRRDGYHRRGLALGMTVGRAARPRPARASATCSAAPSPRTSRPKLAAFEGQYKTERGAGINLGGFPVPGADKSVLNIEIPDVLSVLAYDDAARPRARPGLVPEGRPDAARAARSACRSSAWSGSARTSSRSRSGTGCAAAGGRGRRTGARCWPSAPPGRSRSSPTSSGWMVTELGRQPWVIYGVLRTQDAITTAPGLGAIFAGFTLVYIGLAAMTVWLLRRLATGAPASARAARTWRWRHEPRRDPDRRRLGRPDRSTPSSAARTSAPACCTCSPRRARRGRRRRRRSPARWARCGRPTTSG